MDPRLGEIGEKVLGGGEITREEALFLLEIEGPDTYHLLAYANAIRERFCGPGVELCSLINARSGNCPEDCAFCAQSVHHSTGVAVYPLLDAEAVLQKARAMERAGAHRFDVVTSGYGFRETDPEFQRLLEIFRLLRQETSLELCACLGHLTPQAARALKEAGVSRYNHNLETAPSFFPRICTTHTVEERMATIRAAREAGLEICSGGIIGLGESREQRVELAFTLKELGVDAVPLNVLHPRPGTPLGDRPLLPPLEILRTFAMFRFVLPDKNIRYAGGRELNLGPLQPLGLLAGLNGMLIGGYLTTPGQEIERDLAMVDALGFRR